MRIDEDVLERVRAIAKRERRSIKEQIALMLERDMRTNGATT